MSTNDVRTVDQYIAAQPKPTQTVLGRVRQTIREALPEAEEVISYKIPAYKLQGGIVLYVAGWKRHYSLYPVGPRLAAAFGKELAPYLAGKGTVRFSLSGEVPVKLIERIAKFRAKEFAEHKKTAARKSLKSNA